MAETVLALLDPGGGEPVLADPTTPVLRADDFGVVRGEAVFETMRVAGGRAHFVEAHLARLARSAQRLAIELPTGWERLAQVAVGAYRPADGVLRLTCTKGPPGGVPVGFALVSAIPAETIRGREHGVRAITLTLGVSAQVRAASPWLLGGVKSTSYAVNMASLRHAQGLGVEDVVWVSADGEVLEAPTSTVAWVRDGVLVTPPAADVAILPGTTADVVLGLYDGKTEVRRGTVAELAAADEVLMMSSVRGVAPVIELDGRPLGVGPVTARLRAALEVLFV
ncbi:MAG: 4-amino-4-deoxychorismate lyase [Actinomycetota bacterium]|jgi:4-amino-4-deoxychorismate lyase|nr:4-amino-4-deoxychorismate lyase [Actinomycetota bacterium]